MKKPPISCRLFVLVNGFDLDDIAKRERTGAQVIRNDDELGEINK